MAHIKLYSPDQPRADNGQFGEGGGGGDGGGGKGIGADKVTHEGVPHDVVEHTLGGIHEAGMHGYLDKHPIGRIELRHIDGGGSYGEAKPARTIPASPAKTFRDRGKLVKVRETPERTIPATPSSLSVYTARGADGYGHEFKPGQERSLSTTAKTPKDAARMTMVHELGHHLHLTSGPEADAIVKHAYENASKQKSFITGYASTSHTEYFAECFAAHKYQSDALKAHDPVGHQMVEDVRRRAGV